MWARGVGKLRGVVPRMAPVEVFSMGWTKSPCLHLLRVSPSPHLRPAFKNQALKRIFGSSPASGGSPLCDSPMPRAYTVHTMGAQQGARRVNSKAGRREGSGRQRGCSVGADSQPPLQQVARHLLQLPAPATCPALLSLTSAVHVA